MVGAGNRNRGVVPALARQSQAGGGRAHVGGDGAAIAVSKEKSASCESRSSRHYSRHRHRSEYERNQKSFFMADTILVVVEQREGKLNRVSWETLTAGQAIAAQTGWPLEAAVVGSGVSNLAGEVAGKKVGKVYAMESPKLEPYTPDAFAHALKQFLSARQPRLV